MYGYLWALLLYGALVAHKLLQIREAYASDGYVGLQARVRNLAAVVGPGDVDDVLRMMDAHVADPSVGTRNDIMNVLESWSLRRMDSQRARDYVDKLHTDMRAWTLGYLSADVTAHDAPRANPGNVRAIHV